MSVSSASRCSESLTWLAHGILQYLVRRYLPPQTWCDWWETRGSERDSGLIQSTGAKRQPPTWACIPLWLPLKCLWRGGTGEVRVGCANLVGVGAESVAWDCRVCNSVALDRFFCPFCVSGSLCIKWGLMVLMANYSIWWSNCKDLIRFCI